MSIYDPFPKMDSEDDQCSEPSSLAGFIEEQGELTDRDTPREEELDQELSQDANYLVTMKGVRSFMKWPEN